MQAASDAACQSSGLPSATLPVFLGAYVDRVYGPQFGPRPLQPMARIVASVATHASVYEVRIFGRQAGILSHPNAACIGESAAPSRPQTSRPSPSRSSLGGSGAAAAQALSRTRPTTGRNSAAPALADRGQAHDEQPQGSDSPPGASGGGAAGVSSPATPRQAAPSQQQRPRGLRPSTAFAPHHQLVQQQEGLSRRQKLHQGPAQALALLPVHMPVSCEPPPPTPAAFLNRPHAASLTHASRGCARRTARTA